MWISNTVVNPGLGILAGITPATAVTNAVFPCSLQHGLPGSLLVLSGLPIDWRCHDLHLHKEPAFEKPGPGRSTGSNPWILLKFECHTVGIVGSAHWARSWESCLQSQLLGSWCRRTGNSRPVGATQKDPVSQRTKSHLVILL